MKYQNWHLLLLGLEEQYHLLWLYDSAQSRTDEGELMTASTYVHGCTIQCVDVAQRRLERTSKSVTPFTLQLALSQRALPPGYRRHLGVIPCSPLVATTLRITADCVHPGGLATRPCTRPLNGTSSCLFEWGIWHVWHRVGMMPNILGHLTGGGSDVLLADLDGKTPLSVAREGGHDNVVHRLTRG